MFENYLKIAIRNIRKQKVFSLINIAGLVIGMACCIIILLWAQDELSYDKFHKNASNICRITTEANIPDNEMIVGTSSGLLGDSLVEEYPEILDFTRFRINQENITVRFGEKAFYEDRFAFVDPSFPNIFSLEFIEGDANTALKEPLTVVITEAMADKYFGSDENCIGKILTVANDNDFTVTGVFKNLPNNSHLKFDFLSSIDLFQNSNDYHGWGIDVYTYILLKEGTTYEKLNEKLAGYYKSKLDDKRFHSLELKLQPLTNIHLYSSHLTYDISGHGDIKIVHTFIGVAFLVLFIALINFINLSTVCSGNRVKEIGIRKVIGAKKSAVMKQFFGENIFLIFISIILSLLLAAILLPFLNSITNKSISMDFLGNIRILGGLLLIFIIVGMAACVYPAMYLSRLRPVRIIGKIQEKTTKGLSFRRVLIVMQFAISIILILNSAVVYNQLKYVGNRKLGFNKDQLIYLPLNGALNNQFETFKTEVLKNPDITGVSAVGDFPTVSAGTVKDVDWDGKASNEMTMMTFLNVYYDFVQIFGMEMIEGRSHSIEYSSDGGNAFIVNEEAVKILGPGSPVGKRILMNRKRENGIIIGVVKNSYFKSLHKKVEPMVFRLRQPWSLNFIFLRISGANIENTIKSIENVWNSLNPNYPFTYDFIDKDYENLYESEKKLGLIFQTFTFLSIFVSCLGIFAMVTFMADHRKKEIGVRKVLGASLTKIIALLTKELLLLIIIANILAWPIAYYTMNDWLKNFAYRTNIEVLHFILAGFLVIIIASLTVSYQSLKAAKSQAVDVLKYE